MRIRALTGVAIVVVAAACAQQPPAPTFTPDDEAAIRSLVDTWAANITANRFMDNLELYAEDAVELVTPPAEGRSAIEARWNTFIARYEYSGATARVREMTGWGDDAYAWVEFQDVYRLEGEPRIRDGNWMILLRRGADGAWKIHRNIWSASARPDSTAM